MNQIPEMQKMFSLLVHINDRYAAKADAVIDWERREVVVIIDESGKTLYAATLEIDSPALEAKARLVRHELEQMIAECSLPILWERAA